MTHATDTPHVSTAKFAGRVVVKAAGETIADSHDAIVLHEDGYEPVFYLPKGDIRMHLLEPTDHSTRCPHKGTARYWSVRAGGRTIGNAAWAYDEPLPGVREIAGHLAFYPDRVDAIEAGGL